ncbi:putative magnesium transporter [Psidium guajava]|nr:putative magnesium transporter [Psidium guajava]
MVDVVWTFWHKLPSFQNIIVTSPTLDIPTLQWYRTLEVANSFHTLPGFLMTNVGFLQAMCGDHTHFATQCHEVPSSTCNKDVLAIPVLCCPSYSSQMTWVSFGNKHAEMAV